MRCSCSALRGDYTTADAFARCLFTGTSADMAAGAAALASLGIGHVALRLGDTGSKSTSPALSA